MLTAEDTGATFTLSNAGIFHRFAFFAVVIAIIVGIIIFGSIRIVTIIFRVIVALVFFRVVVRSSSSASSSRSSSSARRAFAFWLFYPLPLRKPTRHVQEGEQN
jgi:hypothetical protein